MSSLSPIIQLYRYGLEPVAPLSWFGVRLGALEIAAAIRLCMVLRQVRESILKKYQLEAKPKGEKNVGGGAAAGGGGGPVFETRSFLRNLTATLLVIHGGEITAPMLGIPPSFLVSGTYPLLYAVSQAIIEYLPTVPEFSLQLELPLSFLDALTRTLLLVRVIPAMVLRSPYSNAATSPWTLLLTSLITANTGFFVINMFSFLHPTALTLTTPTELLPYGWSTTDLWCAPLITGLYALLTHAQPFWAHAHVSLLGWLSSASSKELAPLDHETARAACAALLMVLFSARAVKKFANA